MGRVRLGLLTDCPVVAEAGGAAVVAAPVVMPGRAGAIELRVAVRDPGGSFSGPVPLQRGDLGLAVQAVAIAPSGAAVVAWIQRRGGDRARVIAFRRAPGGSFGPVEPLTPWRKDDLFEDAIAVAAITPDGRATVAWTRAAGRFGGGAAVETVTAAAGERFGGAQRLATRVTQADGPALAVARDGWALLAFTGDEETRVFERPPGASAFRPAARFERVPNGEGEPAVAVRDGGGGVVAWRSTFEHGVAATVRPAAGAFAKPRTAAADGGDPGGFSVATAVFVALPDESGPFAPVDQHGGRLRLALADGGEVVLSWLDERRLGVDHIRAPRAAVGTLDGGLGPAERLGGTVRMANGAAPLRLEDGRAAVAWTDNLSSSQLIDFPRAAGRRHVAIAGAPAPAGQPPPATRVTVPRGQRLYRDEPLRVSVRCAAACDLRAVARRRRAGVVARGDGRLRGAGRALLRLYPGPGPERPWANGPFTAVVRVSAPGASQVARTVARLRVTPRRAPPFARPHGVVARRRGGRVVVTWSTAIRARRVFYDVSGRRTRAQRLRASEFPLLRTVPGRGRRSFRVTLKPRRPRDVRWVELTATARDRPYRSARVVVPVSA